MSVSARLPHSAHFRDHTIAASLRPSDRDNLTLAEPDFRDHTIAASLRLAIGEDAEAPTHDFRDHTIAEEDCLQALTTPMRNLLDALHMIVYRAETRLAAALAPGLSRPETARTLVKAMLSSEASILPDPSAETLTVRLLH